MEYIVIGPNVWGKADTVLQAIANMKKEHRKSGRRGKLNFVTYEVGPNTNVTGMGELSYPSDGPRPKVLREHSRGLR